MRQDWDELFRQMDEWARAVDRFVSHVTGAHPPTPSFATTAWRQAVNVYETEREIVVVAELAGVNPEDVSVQFEPGRLLVSGRRREATPPNARIVHRMEIQSGPFAFQVPLPTQVDAEGAEATCQNGFLEVRLPKRQRPPEPVISVRIRATQREEGGTG